MTREEMIEQLTLARACTSAHGDMRTTTGAIDAVLAALSSAPPGLDDGSVMVRVDPFYAAQMRGDGLAGPFSRIQLDERDGMPTLLLTVQSPAPPVAETPEDEAPTEPPSEADICRLEKLVWDAKLDRVLVWYRDQIEQLRARVRESERATQLEADRRIFAEKKLYATSPVVAPAPVVENRGEVPPSSTWGDLGPAAKCSRCGDDGRPCSHCETPDGGGR